MGQNTETGPDDDSLIVAITTVFVAGLVSPDWLVEIDVVAAAAE